MPLINQMRVDTVWFGILFLMCMQIGLLSPPFGLLLFTMKSVAPPEITMTDVIWAAVPYMIFGLILTVIILFVPGIATWLPRVLG
jgi:TRAP-type mannitol/chloroaromatic compound transport system permease large subunit